MKTWIRSHLPLLLLCACLGLAAGCGGDDDSCGPGIDAAIDTGPDAAVLEDVTFVVVTYTGAAMGYEPIATSMVTFDAPGGERMEATTGADGRVTFEGIDWSLGSGAVSAFRMEHSMRSIVNLDAAHFAQLDRIDGAVVLLLHPHALPAIETVVVSGTVVGLVDPAHEIFVSVLRGSTGSGWTGPGNSTFPITVPKDEPFTIQVFEFEFAAVRSGQGFDRTIYGMMHRDFAPISANTQVVLDFDVDEVPTFTADVWIDLPPRVESSIRHGTPYCYACGFDSLYCSGWPTHADISADRSRFDFSFLWAEPAWMQAPVTYCRLDRENEVSFIFVDGYPQPGSLGQLLDIPRWTHPPDPSFAWPLGEVVAWELFDEEIDNTELHIYRNGQTLWVASAGPNATSLILPELPSMVDPAVFLGPDPLFAQLLVGTWEPEIIQWRRLAANTPIMLTP